MPYSPGQDAPTAGFYWYTDNYSTKFRYVQLAKEEDGLYTY